VSKYCCRPRILTPFSSAGRLQETDPGRTGLEGLVLRPSGLSGGLLLSPTRCGADIRPLRLPDYLVGRIGRGRQSERQKIRLVQEVAVAEFASFLPRRMQGSRCCLMALATAINLDQGFAGISWPIILSGHPLPAEMERTDTGATIRPFS